MSRGTSGIGVLVDREAGGGVLHVKHDHTFTLARLFSFL